MKNYTITVNGKAYDVTVEDKGGSIGGAAPVAAPAPQAQAPVAQAQPDTVTVSKTLTD